MPEKSSKPGRETPKANDGLGTASHALAVSAYVKLLWGRFRY